MYLHEIFLQNTGPISECHVKLPFDNGNPLPVVIVGPNGSGKTIFLSYIVDALTEFAKKAFTDIVPKDGSISSPYFRIVGSTTVRSGQPFSLSLLHFKVNNDNLHFCEKIGTPDMSVYSNDLTSVFSSVWNRPTIKDPKYVSVNPKTVETDMQSGAHAFFPASRREDPHWLNQASLKTEMDASAYERFIGKLDKPLWVGTCAEENISWVLDVFLDSLVDFDKQQQLNRFVNTLQTPNLEQPITLPQELLLTANRVIFVQARKNVEQILQTILQDQAAELVLNFRTVESSRISIRMGDGQSIPTLQSLSEGQSQLFHLFATIIRYGEHVDLNKSIHLHEITGLVVIDEIDTHLHPTLQHDVLPQLIGMFPKVQFVVSSHSPLFLLGMEKRFGIDRVTILEMPEAKRINSERYSEFGRAFEYIQSTERFEEEIKQRFAAGIKPLILTEGPLDPRYIQAALARLGEKDLLNSFDVDFVGREDEKGTHYGGDKGLNHFRNIYAANPSLFHRPILLLYDCDTKKLPEQIGELCVRLIPKNEENTKVTKGIENLLPEVLFKDEFYSSKIEKGDYGEKKTIEDFRKKEFCNWICENGSDVDFAKFESVVNILREFIAAHQPPPDQQQTPSE
jgi:hypothetical protein